MEQNVETTAILQAGTKTQLKFARGKTITDSLSGASIFILQGHITPALVIKGQHE